VVLYFHTREGVLLKTIRNLVIGAVFVVLCLVGVSYAVQAYEDWQFHQRFEDQESFDFEEATEWVPGQYHMTLPLCVSSTKIELTPKEARISCEDGSDFQVEISDNLIFQLMEIEGIAEIDVSVDVVVFRQSGDHHWLPLLTKAGPILLRELEG